MISESPVGIVSDPSIRMPEIDKFSGWKEVPIVESGQPLVSLESYNDQVDMIFSPAYFEQELPGAISEMLLREEAAERLFQAAKLLPDGHSFVIYDAYRPLIVQQSLFDSYKEVLRGQEPDLSEDELFEETQRYVSLPSDNLTRPSPHYTGGSVDLSIQDENHSLLDMGTPFDSFDSESKTAFYQDKDGEIEQLYQENRILLFKVMIQAGFTNYPEEWWHFDFGNQFWGRNTGQVAKYGGIKPSN